MTGRIKTRLDTAVEKATEIAKGGLQARDAADQVFDDTPFSDGELAELAREGFAMRVNQAVSRYRGSLPPKPSSYEIDRDEQRKRDDLVKRLHSLVGCPFSSHTAKRQKREACVGRIADLPIHEREAAIEKEKERNLEFAQEQRQQRDEAMAETLRSIEEATAVFEEEIRRDEAKKILDSIRFTRKGRGKGRGSKSLSEFTLEDYAWQRQHNETQMESAKTRIDFFSFGEERLLAAGVESTDELSVDDVEEIAQRARQVWKS